jgi:hypothetical protein
MDNAVVGLAVGVITLLGDESVRGNGGGGLSHAVITNIRDVAINVVVPLRQPAALQNMPFGPVAG